WYRPTQRYLTTHHGTRPLSAVLGRLLCAHWPTGDPKPQSRRRPPHLAYRSDPIPEGSIKRGWLVHSNRFHRPGDLSQFESGRQQRRPSHALPITAVHGYARIYYHSSAPSINRPGLP